MRVRCCLKPASQCDCVCLVRVSSDGGFQHDPTSRGQPPLAFYQSAAPPTPASPRANHAASADMERAYGLPRGGGTEEAGEYSAASGGYASALLATSPDRSNPVVQALLPKESSSSSSSGGGGGGNGGAEAIVAGVSSALGIPLRLSSSASFLQVTPTLTLTLALAPTPTQPSPDAHHDPKLTSPRAPPLGRT